MISLAAGVCWEAKLLIEHGIKEMDFLDFSEHRIMKIAPYVLEYLQCPEECNIRLIWGSYYEVRMPDCYYDCVILSEALMMAEDPNKLLKECYRLLKGGGYILIVGEPKMKRNKYREINRMVRGIFGMKVNFATDISGAHKYYLSEYRKLFKKTGFSLNFVGEDNKEF